MTWVWRISCEWRLKTIVTNWVVNFLWCHLYDFDSSKYHKEFGEAIENSDSDWVDHEMSITVLENLDFVTLKVRSWRDRHPCGVHRIGIRRTCFGGWRLKTWRISVMYSMPMGLKARCFWPCRHRRSKPVGLCYDSHVFGCDALLLLCLIAARYLGEGRIKNSLYSASIFVSLCAHCSTFEGSIAIVWILKRSSSVYFRVRAKTQNTLSALSMWVTDLLTV